MEKKYLTINEAAMLLNIRPNTLHKWDQSGYFKATTTGGRTGMGFLRLYDEEIVRAFKRDKMPLHSNLEPYSKKPYVKKEGAKRSYVKSGAYARKLEDIQMPIVTEREKGERSDRLSQGESMDFKTYLARRTLLLQNSDLLKPFSGEARKSLEGAYDLLNQGVTHDVKDVESLYLQFEEDLEKKKHNLEKERAKRAEQDKMKSYFVEYIDPFVKAVERLDKKFDNFDSDKSYVQLSLRLDNMLKRIDILEKKSHEIDRDLYGQK